MTLIIFSSQKPVFAFLWEDLGLDMYKKIDEGFFSLELKQYEYEMTGQGEASVGEVVNQQLEKYGVECNIQNTQEIEDIVGGERQVEEIFKKCSQDGEKLPNSTTSLVLAEIEHLRNTKKQDAANKSKNIYDIARIGLYSDGVSENSPFDIIVDLQDIDRVIFWEPIEYEGEEWEGSTDELLEDFLEEDKDYLYEDDEDTGSGNIDTGSGTTDTGSGTTDTGSWTTNINDPNIYHEYLCRDPLVESGIGSGSLDDIDDIIDLEDLLDNGSGGINITHTFTPITDNEYTNGASWGGPFRGVGPNSPYSEVTDSWDCRDQFFCIVIEFVMKNQNLLWWGESLSIKKVLETAMPHMEKAANTSLVQSKMTTNNFELGLIIPNLGDMLRGLGIQVQTKPIPILNNIEKSDAKKEALKWDVYTGENMLHRYYKNLGQDYERRNDMDIFRDKTYEKKVFEESTGLPVTFPPAKLAELEKFQESLAERNRVLSLGVQEKAVFEDQSDFYDQFLELERFVGSVEDFCTSMVGIIKKMKQIPTRSS